MSDPHLGHLPKTSTRSNVVLCKVTKWGRDKKAKDLGEPVRQPGQSRDFLIQSNRASISVYLFSFLNP